jgi:hypothetical protein
VLALCDDLYTTLTRGRERTVLYTDKTMKCLIVIVLNLYAAFINDDKRYVRYSRRPGKYIGNRYNPQRISYRRLKPKIDGLQSAGFLEQKLGIPGQRRFSDGRQSRMRASALLMKRFAELLPEMIERVPDEEVLILKSSKSSSSKGRFIDYPETTETNEMRNRIREINEYLAGVQIELYISDKRMRQLAEQLRRDPDREPIDFGRTTLRRIFNDGRWDHGGRFYYGWWQEIPRTDRGFVLLNHHQTVEIDFSGIHLTILYIQAGHGTFNGDPYDIGCEPQYRGLIKKALNIMINAGSDRKALEAIRESFKEMGAPRRYPTPERLVNALKDMHSGIRQYFGSGAGVAAQFVDSQIAERVMLSLGRRGIAVLPVHDSFIVDELKESHLRDAMDEAFKAETTHICGVKIKNPPWLERMGERPELGIESLDANHRQEFAGFYRRDLEWQRKIKRMVKGGWQRKEQVTSISRAIADTSVELQPEDELFVPGRLLTS